MKLTEKGKLVLIVIFSTIMGTSFNQIVPDINPYSIFIPWVLLFISALLIYFLYGSMEKKT